MADTSSSNLPVPLDNVRKVSEQENREKYAWWKRTRTQDLTKLKAWHILAIMRHYLFGDGYEELARDFGRRPDTIRKVLQSPAGLELREWLADTIEDPVEFARATIEANTTNIALDWLLALEWAKEAKDYDSVARITKDLAAIAGVQPKAQKTGSGEKPTTINITFEGRSLNTKPVEASFEIVDDEEDPDDL